LELLEDEVPELEAYIFNENGQFITSEHFAKAGRDEVKIELPSEYYGTVVRVVIGPRINSGSEELPLWMNTLMNAEERDGTLKLSQLLRKGAYEKRHRIITEQETLDVKIFPPDWKNWLLCKCVVRGKVVKRIPLPDGRVEDLGVCFACVKIYEVDKFVKVIQLLPESDLFALRDDLRFILEKKLPEIKVWPPPPPPPPIQNVNLYSASSFQSAEPSFSENLALKPKSNPISYQFEEEITPILTAATAIEIRNALIERKDILVTLLCLWEKLNMHFHSDLIKCVCTDEQGRFETTIWYPCSGDKPDLYFKVMQCIKGTLHTLYDPGIACNTYWNYDCTKEVLLEVTDPAARTCVPPLNIDPPLGVSLWVMPYAVGGTRLDKIKQPSGVTDYGTMIDAPFGSRLGFRHGYSSVFPDNNPGKPFYYRWRYKKEGDSEWSNFDVPIVRHYVDTEDKPGAIPTFPVYTLGPKSKNGVDGLYEFKPHEPPQLTGHITEWPIDDWFGDIYTGILNSHVIPGGVDVTAGKYKIKLEIFDPSGICIVPEPKTSGTFRFIVPIGLKSDGVTIDTREAEVYEIEDDGKGNVGFIFYLHIDNRKCQAIIDPPSISGVSASDDCGFLRYTIGDPSPVHIAFHALHPDNFATFSFHIRRGNTPISNASGEVDSSSVVDSTMTGNSYSGDGFGNFDRDISLTNLLGTCDEAAFAETIHVKAKATNGWSRLTSYDDYTVRAFALSSKKKKEK
jgi:hypothetical protein